MKKITITVGLLLLMCTCSTQRNIYSSKKTHESISNLETMREWLLNDVKDGTNMNHYNLLIDKTIYNLKRNIIPKKPHTHNASFTFLNEQLLGLELKLNYALHGDELGEVYYDALMKELIEIKTTIKNIKNGW
mgnify:CR=1 FL=1